MNNFLLEIGLEEMPAHVVTPSAEQLKTRMETFLNENRISFASVEMYSTPRRLAVKVLDLAEKQEDVQEEVKGPAKKIAYDENGELSKAVLGFLRGKGLTEKDLTFKEVNGVEYAFATKEEKGRATVEILQDLPKVIQSMTFPVSMRWADHDQSYIRPIHWLVALLDEKIIDLEVFGVKSSNTTRSHRLLNQVVEIPNATSYEATLESVNVIADSEKRKNVIRTQIEKIAQDKNCVITLDEDLLEEVNNLVEMPTAFLGNFDPKYLEVPEEVLVTSMKEHQRFFETRSTEGTLLPHFVSVRNGGSEHIENVIKGNEKVLVARLEDGEFFWQEDQKLKLADLVEKLSKITFHEKIGSLSKHMLRTKAIAEVLANALKLTDTEKADLLRASDIYKFDLVTNMVGEFPELQGIMGEKYSAIFGENANVSTAIREHYMPIAATSELPTSTVGAVLAVADKLESLFSFFSVDLIPSGSNDPYAIRRATQGVIRILTDKNWKLPFGEMISTIFEKINEDENYDLVYQNEEEILTFIKGRIQQLMAQSIDRNDVIEAVLASSQTEVATLFDSAKVILAHSEDANFKEVLESLTRVVNIAQKAPVAVDVNTALFETEEEKALHETLMSFTGYKESTPEEKYQKLASCEKVIANYFENTMVMSDNEAVKNNRLSELKTLSTMIQQLFDVTKIVVQKAEK